MFPIAGQMAGLNFFVDTHGWPGGIFLEIVFPRATPGPSASL